MKSIHIVSRVIYVYMLAIGNQELVRLMKESGSDDVRLADSIFVGKWQDR